MNYKKDASLLIHKTAIIYDNCDLAFNTAIGPYSVIGLPTRSLKLNSNVINYIGKSLQTIICERVFVGSNVIIEAGVRINEDVVIEHGSIIENGAVIGKNTFIVNGSRILKNARIGDNCVIGGLIGDNCIIGDNCRLFGNVIHRQDDPSTSWDGTIEQFPVIEDNVFAGMGSNIIGNILIKHHSYICSNAIVTKNFEPFTIIKGVNQACKIEDWKGLLKQSKFWKTNNDKK